MLVPSTVDMTAAESPVTAELHRLARAADVGVDALALAAALAQPWCDVVLTGAVTVPQLIGNTAALNLDPSVDVTQLVQPQSAADYWADRSRLPWS